MAELSNIEKVLMDKFGWEDRGDGTLLSSAGKVYDHEAGDTFEERHGLDVNYTPVDTSPALENNTTGATIAVGSNPELDKAISEGNPALEGVTIKDGIYMMPDGVTPLTYAGSTPAPAPSSTPVDTTPIPASSPTDVTPTDSMSGAEITGNMLNGANAAKEANAPIIRLTSLGDGQALIYFPNGDIVRVQQGIAEANLNYAKSTGVNINSRDDYNKFVVNLSSKASDPFSIEAAVSKQGSDLHASILNAQKGKTKEELAVEANTYANNNLLSIKDVGTAVAAPLPADFEQQIAAIKAAQAAGNLDEAQELLNILSGQANIPAPSAPTPTPTPTPDAGTTPAPAPSIGTTPTPTAPSTPTPTPAEPPTSAVFTAPVVTTPSTPAPVAPTIPSAPAPVIDAPMTGTFTKPVTTSMLGTQPSQAITFGQPTTQPFNVTQPQQYDVRMFRNDAGMTTSITFVNGQPTTPIPSGFYPIGEQPVGQMPFTPVAAPTPVPTVAPVTGFKPVFMNQGGAMMPPTPPVQSASVFGGFKPESMQRIASSLGYNENMGGFDQFLNDNPDKKQKMDNYTMRAKQMVEGGMVQKFANGGMPESTTVDLQQYDTRALAQQYIPQQPSFAGKDLTGVQVALAKTPGLPAGATVVPVGTQLEKGQIVSPYSGQVTGASALPTSIAATEQAFLPTTQTATLMSPIEASGAIRAAADQTQAAQIGQVSMIDAAQQATSSVSDIKAAQGKEILMTNPVQRKVEDGEIISGVANAETAAKFTEELEAATAEPSKQATVAGQLEGLLQQFEGGNTPAWAAGSMRAATNAMISRGLGASSIAGQAIVQAAMESALPIAQIDASTQARFEAQNLSNRQQNQILAAQQRAKFIGQEFDQAFQSRVANAARIADIANMNFTAEQQVALENSRIANTMNLTNLSNSQAMVLAEAAALANLDMSNLNNRQQAAVQNAQNFLQADLSNLSNKQSTELFKAQQRIQSLFTDQAALNSAQQFNATSQNQVDQFYANMQNQTAQFNAAQANAQAQFNAGQVNTIERFNTEINNQRDQFNAQNRLVIDQANAQWRRQIATADTAAVNRSNEINAQALLGYSQTAYNNLWQFYKDNMHWAWTSADNERDRYARVAIAQIQKDAALEVAEFKADANASSGFGSLVGKILTTDLTNTALGGLFG